jgi:hypothetical protein
MLIKRYLFIIYEGKIIQITSQVKVAIAKETYDFIDLIFPFHSLTKYTIIIRMFLS